MIRRYAELLLSWPVIVLVLGLVYRTSVQEALQRLTKFKGFGQEAEFGTKLAEAEEVAKENPPPEIAAPEAPGPTVSVAASRLSEPWFDYATQAEEEPSYVILLSWEDLNERVVGLVRSAYERLGKHGRQYSARSYPTPNELAPLIQEGIIRSSDFEIYRELRDLRNRVAHGRHRPSPGEAVTYVELASRLWNTMQSVSRHPSQRLFWYGDGEGK